MFLLHELNISECYRTTGCWSGPELAVVLVDLFNCFSVLHFSKTRISIVSRGGQRRIDQLPRGLTGQTG